MGWQWGALPYGICRREAWYISTGPHSIIFPPDCTFHGKFSLLLAQPSGFEREINEHCDLSNWPTWCTKSCFLISLLHSSTCFEHCCARHQEVKFYYTASGIITLCRWPPGAHVLSQPVHGTATYRCDDTRCCIIQFWPPDDEHNSARNMQRNIINLLENKNLCVKLVSC